MATLLFITQLVRILERLTGARLLEELATDHQQDIERVKHQESWGAFVNKISQETPKVKKQQDSYLMRHKDQSPLVR